MTNLRQKLGALVMTAAAAATALHTTGCIGGGCGVGPAPGPNNQDGTVTFDPVSVGSSEQLSVPFQDSADVDETLESATITGPGADAFEVLSTFPIPVPAGGTANVEIRFAPSTAGGAEASLVLQTKEMGPSPVELVGTGD